MDGIADGLDVAGAATHGALAARAIEDEAGSGAGPATATCANCVAPVVGAYCAACGQKAELHRSVRGFLHDLAHGVMHFDGKLWRTLPLLAWRPGRLTRRYIDGERRRFFSPIAIFLFVAFCTYLGFSMLAPPAPETGVISASADDLDAGQSLDQLDEQIETLEERSATAEGVEQEALQVAIERMRDQRDALPAEGEETTEGAPSSEPTFDPGPFAAVAESARENPALAVYKLQTNAYKFAWALIPLSAPFVWLLFLWRRFPMYDHVVFTTYSIAFMTALSGVSALLIAYVSEPVGGALLLYAPFHLYRQLRGTYGLSRFSALWRLLALSVFIWLVIGLFLTLIGMGLG